MRKSLQKLKSLAKSNKKIRRKRATIRPIRRSQLTATTTLRSTPMMHTRVHHATEKAHGEPIHPRIMIEPSMDFLEVATGEGVAACEAIVVATEAGAKAMSAEVVEASTGTLRRIRMGQMITIMPRVDLTEDREEVEVVQEAPGAREEARIIAVEALVNIGNKEAVVVEATRTIITPKLSTSQQRNVMMLKAALRN
jgi:HSP20 family molecular chaperone IbpA